MLFKFQISGASQQHLDRRLPSVPILSSPVRTTTLVKWMYFLLDTVLPWASHVHASVQRRELGFTPVEVNASDTRNKADKSAKVGMGGKLSNGIKELANNTALGVGQDGHRKRVCCPLPQAVPHFTSLPIKQRYIEVQGLLSNVGLMMSSRGTGALHGERVLLTSVQSRATPSHDPFKLELWLGVLRVVLALLLPSLLCS